MPVAGRGDAMKVGDIVRQGDRILKMKGRAPSKAIGMVVAIEGHQVPARGVVWNKKWEKFLGRLVTVVWSNGRKTDNMAEHSLEVVSEEG